ncbi:DUF1501 domain-containing protein [Armatimonas sp.]|uniref:DUF1501 domain-containing protein n=1 Tax=Armatimonas sp. TaxID=1872638 RepID=UPI00286C2D5F|nr:DUF1501 domain-containing protein [Armatimonas sp.]
MRFDQEEFIQSVNRRTFLKQSAYGVGGLALSALFGAEARADSGKLPDFAPRIKRVIHLCMAGGPSHLETLDWKPKLRELHGQPFPSSFTNGQQLAQLQNAVLKAFGPQHEFTNYGKSGLYLSTALPLIGSLADDICVVKSMVTEQINHDTAHAFMNSGSILKSRPSMGSWVLYGLGTSTKNLPGFIVLTSQGRGGAQPVSARQWSSGFLPSKFQGVQLQTRGDAVHYVGSPEGVCQSTQRLVVEEIARLNGMLAAEKTDPEIATRIAQYELAFQMQASVPELTDMAKETQATLDLYGVNKPGDGTFASNCLLARRLAERGVRFIQLYHRGWDHHGGVKNGITQAATECDRATWALITDLKQRGMLDDTLVIWGGEFGRTPMGQGDGRDHHINAFSIFLAGGGIKGGTTYGNTDELGYKSVENVVSVHDLHATMLHLFGIDHERFSIKFQGLDAKLSGVEPARVVKDILV